MDNIVDNKIRMLMALEEKSSEYYECSCFLCSRKRIILQLKKEGIIDENFDEGSIKPSKGQF